MHDFEDRVTLMTTFHLCWGPWVTYTRVICQFHFLYWFSKLLMHLHSLFFRYSGSYSIYFSTRALSLFLCLKLFDFVNHFQKNDIKKKVLIPFSDAKTPYVVIKTIVAEIKFEKICFKVFIILQHLFWFFEIYLHSKLIKIWIPLWF